MVSLNYPDNNHRCGTGRTHPGTCRCGRFWQRIIRGYSRFNVKQCPGLLKALHPRGIGHPAVVTNAVEASGQYMHEEPANKLAGVQCHGLLASAALLPIVLPLEGDAVLIEGE